MKNASQVKALMVDNGLFLPLGLKLGESFEKVWYYSPCEDGFPTINRFLIGDGYEQVERCNDIWEVIPQIDLAIFPDVGFAGLQEHIESLGIPVWGSRYGDELELNRPLFHRTLEELELPFPKWVVVQGLSKLREHLKKHDDKWIKISKYRGAMESWHHRTYKESEAKLDILAVRFGPAKEMIPFIVVDALETDLEIGSDTYCVDGNFPSLVLHGYECKDTGYLAAFQKYSELPEQVRRINDAFAPLLGEYRYRNFWSNEIRIVNDEPYFIDPTNRAPSPSIESQIELYGNLAEIVWAGANGELVDPEPTAQFAAEVVVTQKADKGQWRTVDIPERVKPWFKAMRSCFIDGEYCWPPDNQNDNEIGWLVGIGDTLEDAIDEARQHIDDLADAPVHCDLNPIIELLAEIREAEAEGIEFTDQKIPKPESVLAEK